METKEGGEFVGTDPLTSKNLTPNEPTMKELSSKLTPYELKLEKSIPMEINEVIDNTEINVETSKSLECEEMDEPTAKPLVAKFPTIQKKVHLPEGLTVTMIQEQEKDAKLEDTQLVVEDNSSLRSENAKTPVGEDLLPHQGYLQQQQEEMIGSTAADQLQNDAGETDKAPALGVEEDAAEVPLEEEKEKKEPEFDYYGCEICKGDARQCDRFTFSHKCPICPCNCFCAHLLKEHMKVMHGWFNVQRRFTQF